ncbi:hypothetical protein D9758_009913 [Tetrapyrgos nigripes]|uniref:Uncharacterized protein n=1 Tax=Tetrapyrgos nigripes TaxID=182062 RepID=A0A8H5GMG8_9AGAR|nr:hypothetical protein D9758_009913 [Tetrapyrgos nigripes]
MTRIEQGFKTSSCVDESFVDVDNLSNCTESREVPRTHPKLVPTYLTHPTMTGGWSDGIRRLGAPPEAHPPSESETSSADRRRIIRSARSPNTEPQRGLDGALESFVQDGDELVVFRGIKEHDLGCLGPPNKPGRKLAGICPRLVPGMLTAKLMDRGGEREPNSVPAHPREEAGPQNRDMATRIPQTGI